MLGAIGGAVFAVPLTIVGKLVSQAPPADAKNYFVNIGSFAVMGALASPLLTWSALRHAPLWRAMAEPAIGAIVGSALGAFLIPPYGLLFGAPVGAGLATWRLHRHFGAQAIRHPEARAALLSADTHVFPEHQI